jgi:hypothetical protein
MTSIQVASSPLKERYYIYRRLVLHQRMGAAKDDDLYHQIKGKKDADKRQHGPELQVVLPPGE